MESSTMTRSEQIARMVRGTSRWGGPAIAAAVAVVACSVGPHGGAVDPIGRTKSALATGTQWFPVGPLGALPNLGPLFTGNHVTAPSTLNETGRGTALAVNPQNPFDVYLATTGGLWEAPNLPISSANTGTPSTNPWTLIFGAGLSPQVGGDIGPGAIGAVEAEPSACDGTHCNTLWAGTGEAGIRRETFPGTGLYKLAFTTTGGEFPQSGYVATREPGSDTITGGAIGSLALYKPTGATANRVYFTVTGADTSSGYDATVFHPPPSAGFGVFVFDDNNPTSPITRENVPPGDATTLNLPGSVTIATDSQGNKVLLASFYNRGIYRKVLPSGSWCPLDPGAPAVAGCPAASATLPNPTTSRFDHVALASNAATVFATYGDCSNVWSANGAGVSSFTCTSSAFVSTDAGATWTVGVQASGCSGFSCLIGYTNYTHGPAISPLPPNELYFSGFGVNVSLDQGKTFPAELNNVHPDVHGVVISPTTWNAQFQPGTGSLHLAYVACDGGLAINLLDPSSATALAGNNTVPLAEPPVFSIDKVGVAPCKTGQTCSTAVMAGTNDNGTVFYNGGRVWTTISSADIGDVQFTSTGQGIVSWYAVQPSTVSTSAFNNLTQSFIPFSAITDFDSTEFGKAAASSSGSGSPSSPDGHGKVMLPPFVRDSVSGNFYYGTDRVYKVSASAVASGSPQLVAMGNRLSDDLGPCTRPGSDPRGSCPAFQYCVASHCRKYYTDIEKIDAISALASQSDQVYAGMYSGEFFKLSGGAFVQVTNVPTKRACSAGDIGVINTPLGATVGPTPFDSNALSNGNRCAPITAIDVKPGNPNQAYVTIGGFNNSGKHVYLYTNGSGGDTWTPLADGALTGDVPAFAIRADPAVPGHVFVGTDVGLFERTKDDSTGPWALVTSVPPVAVDDIVFDPALGRAYAGTHGRGVYMTVTNPVVELFAGWMDPSMCPPNQPCIWDLLVYGQGFQQPALGQNGACTVNILDQDGNVCAGGSVDAFSKKTIQVLPSNMIGQTVFNESDGKAVIAACFNGNCVGSNGTVPISACEPDAQHPNRILSAVQVLCPNNSGVTVNVGKNCPQLQSPPASNWNPMLIGDPPAGPPVTSITIIAALDGMPMQALCSVTIPIFGNDEHDDIIDRARAAFAASATCQAAGVRVKPAPPAPTGVEVEDLAFTDSLQISAPNAVGRALYLATITDPSSTVFPGLCQHYDGFPGYASNQLDIMDTTFSTLPSGARGGTVTFTETSPLGRCSVSVQTTPGETASAIAQAVEAAYQAAYPTDSNPGCPYSSNPGDLVTTSPNVPLAPGTLNTIAATSLDVCITDTAVGFSLGPDGVPLLSATLAQAALFAEGTLIIKDGVQVTEPSGGFALVANGGNGQTALSPGVSVGSIISVASVTLGDRVNVPGVIKTSGTVTLGNQDTIGGPIVSSTGVILPNLSSYVVTFPTTFAAGSNVGPGGHATLAPGAYQSTSVQSRGSLSLSAGSYFFTSVDFEPQANVSLDDTGGPVVIYLRDSSILRGTFSSIHGGDPKLRIVYEGTGALTLNAPFSGTVVVPNGELDLAPGNGIPYRGSFFAQNIQVADAQTLVVHLPAQ